MKIAVVGAGKLGDDSALPIRFSGVVPTYADLSIIGLSTLVMAINLVCASGLPAAAFRHSIFQAASIIGPLGNFGGFHPVAKWVLSFLVLAGRLEILTIFVMFTPGFWRR